MMRITISITVLNDERVARTIKSLEEQTLVPTEVVIADGGSSKEFIDFLEDFIHSQKWKFKIQLESYIGTVGETRKQYIEKYMSLSRNGDVLVFIDADEIAPKEWLEKLIYPIEKKGYHFSGGMTKPLLEPKNKCEEFVNNYDDWYYKNVVKNDITMLPMGNSAWRAQVFKVIGNFEFTGNAEDIDLNIRAVKSGLKGIFIEDAWVWHDQSNLDSLWKIFYRKYKYAIGATFAYFKNENIFSHVPNAVGTVRCLHPIEFMNLIAKTFGVIHGFMLWRKEV